MSDQQERVEQAEAEAQGINTTQPKVLRGLQIRGVKANKMIRCDGPEGGRSMLVKAEDYDKTLHGPKSKADKLPTRTKKASKKADKSDK